MPYHEAFRHVNKPNNALRVILFLILGVAILRPSMATAQLQQGEDNTNALVIGDFVWQDLNHNGVQDGNEPPLIDVTVNLYTGDGSTLIGTTLTDAAGHFEFRSVSVVGGIQPNSTYQLKLNHEPDQLTGGPLRNFFITIRDRGGDDKLDSDARYDLAGYPTILISTNGLVDSQSYDFGLYAGNCIGDVAAVLSDDGTLAIVSNNSEANQYVVGLAAYTKFDNIIDNQVLASWNTMDIAPGETAELLLNLPAGPAQIDLFCGPLHFSLLNQRYGSRLITSRHIGGSLFDPSPVDLAVGTIQGQVLSPDGPSANTVITAVRMDTNDWRTLYAGIISPDDLYSFTTRQDTVYHTTADSTALFKLSSLPLGQYLVTATDPSPAARRMSSHVALTAEAPNATINLGGSQLVPTAIQLSQARSTPTKLPISWLALLLLSLSAATLIAVRLLRRPPQPYKP